MIGVKTEVVNDCVIYSNQRADSRSVPDSFPLEKLSRLILSLPLTLPFLFLLVLFHATLMASVCRHSEMFRLNVNNLTEWNKFGLILIRKDSAIRVYPYSLSTLQKDSYGGVKEKCCQKSTNLSFHASRHVFKCLKSYFTALSIKDSTFLCKMVPVSINIVKQSPNTSIYPEKCFKKRPFSYERGHNFARGARCGINGTLYAMSISPLSNRVYRKSIRSSTAEQSAREAIGFCAFFVVFKFPASHVKSMAIESTP